MITTLENRQLSVVAAAKIAGVSTRSIKIAVRPNGLAKELEGASQKKKIALAGAVSRLAIFCHVKPEDWLEIVGLKGVVPMVRGSQYTEAAMNSPVTIEDVQYILRVLEGLQQPMTMGMVFDLIRLRSPKPASE